MCRWNSAQKSADQGRNIIRLAKAAHPIRGPNSRSSFRTLSQPLAAPWGEIFEPLRAGTVDEMVVVGQIGQSLDGRIATATGHSKYINGPAGLDHLHRLRSLVDAVVIGVGTALADDPQLTVRRVAGPHPARVVVDPNGRLPASARVFAKDGVRRLLVTAEGTTMLADIRGGSSGLARCRRTYRSSRHPRRTGRARVAPHPHRGRGRHSIKLPRCRLPRPSACDGRTDHPWRRACKLHLAPNRASRSGITHADTRPSTRRRGIVRLRPVGSACAGRPRENIDMTDAD